VTKIDELLEIMRRLRDPENGCPWDLEQTFASIVPHTLEEAYEVADCIERRELDGLPAELGDLLFQVVFYAQLGQEEGLFDFDDVVAAISHKLTSRHPHVFGDGAVVDAADQTLRWEEHKAAERGAVNAGATVSELDGIPRALPGLSRAKKVQQRAARVGFDWPDSTGARLKVVEEFNELENAITAASKDHIEEEMGDLLFACVNWARHLGVDPESAVRAATGKFERRFNYIEKAVEPAGVAMADVSLATMEELWERSKLAERTGAPAHGEKKRVR